MSKVASANQGPHRKWVVLFILATLVFVSAISELCAYQIRREGYVVNFPIVTMLTPSGLLGNLVFGGNPELHRFYFRESTREGVWENPALAVVILATVASAGFWLWISRRRRRP